MGDLPWAATAAWTFGILRILEELEDNVSRGDGEYGLARVQEKHRARTHNPTQWVIAICGSGRALIDRL